jgi:hypothetical protein
MQKNHSYIIKPRKIKIRIQGGKGGDDNAQSERKKEKALYCNTNEKQT